MSEMKSWPTFFQAIKAGTRTSDIRSKGDRHFEVGQVWLLREFDPAGGGYTGDSLSVEITHITSNDTPCALSSVVLDQDYCVLSIKVVGDLRTPTPCSITAEMIERMKDAVEGECHGLVIEDHHAKAIIEYVLQPGHTPSLRASS